MGNQVQKGPGVKKLRKLFNSPGLGMHSQRAIGGGVRVAHSSAAGVTHSSEVGHVLPAGLTPQRGQGL